MLFDSERKRMTTVNRVDGEILVLTKGALETVLPRCPRLLKGAEVEPLDAPERQVVDEAYEDLMNAGLRVMAFAYKSLGPGETVGEDHGEERWADIPGGGQRLCYNEVPTKINWHYLKVGFDFRVMRYTELQCNDHSVDVSRLGGITIAAMPNLWNLLNVIVFVETDADKRAFAYFDSILLSGDVS